MRPVGPSISPRGKYALSAFVFFSLWPLCALVRCSSSTHSSATDSISVTIRIDSADTLLPARVAFTALCGGIPSGCPYEVNWNFGDGDTDTGITVEHLFAVPDSCPRPFFQPAQRRTVLGPENHSGTSAPHTLSVVRPNPHGQWNGHTFWGYVGEQGAGACDLWFSEDLAAWTPHPDNPILAGDSLRWPSVLFNGTYMWMVHTVNFFASSYLVLEKSADGIRFERAATLIDSAAGEGRQNPWLFRDPREGNIVLLWFHKHEGTYHIKARRAATMQELETAKDSTLLHSKGVLAAPSLFHHCGAYWLQVEIKPGNSWQTESYRGPTAFGPFTKTAGNPILPDDDACPFPYVHDDTLHNFICSRDSNDIWRLDAVRYSLRSDMAAGCREECIFTVSVAVADNHGNRAVDTTVLRIIK